MKNSTIIKTKRHGIIYVRVSSSDQVEGTSLDDQVTRCQKYCDENGIDIVATFREEGVSAKSADRKKLLEAIEFCRKNKGSVQAFVVYKVDRFARNIQDHVAVKKTLIGYGTSLISVSEPIGNNPTEKLMETMLAGFAEFDNDIRKIRCSDGMLARLKQGIWPWKPPVGYICAQNKKQGLKKTQPDKPDTRVSTLIQECLSGYAKEIYTATDIVTKLKKADFYELTGIKPTPQLVDRLTGKCLWFYAGLLPNPWPEKEDGSDRYLAGAHKAMITENEMDRIRLTKSGKHPNKIVRDRYNKNFPLRRLARCPGCNDYYTGSTSTGRSAKYHYYHCQTETCPNRNQSIRKHEIEDAFEAVLECIKLTPAFFKYFREKALVLWTNNRDFLADMGKKYEKAIEDLKEQRRNICLMREKGEYDIELFKERLAEVDSAITVNKISLNEVSIDTFDIEAGISYAEQFVSDIKRQWLDMEPLLRPRFHKLLFPQGLRYDRKTGYGTVEVGLIFKLNEEFVLSNSFVVDPTGIEPVASSLQMRRSTK